MDSTWWYDLLPRGRPLRLLNKVLPSFLQRQHDLRQQAPTLPIALQPLNERPNSQRAPGSSQDNIKHLDGLRGVACFFVFNFHFLYPWTRTPAIGFVYNSRHHYIHQLPFLCLFVRGRAMVALFFAISGYVLSYKTLKLARKNDNTKEGDILRTLSSSAFRRAIRLYGPPFVSMLAVALTIQLGFFDRGQRIQRPEKGGHKWLTGYLEEHPIRFPGWSAQKDDFIKMLGTWADPWTWDPYYSHYGPHTWTIPVEFRSSLVLFLVLLASCRIRRVWRMTITFGLVGSCLVWGRWDVALFLGGMILVELDLLRKESNSAQADAGNPDAKSKRLSVLTSLAFVFGLYLLSFPDRNAANTPGYKLLASLTPQVYKLPYLYWHAFGSWLMLWSVNNTKGMRSLLESNVCQYLGKTSFAFYLVQGPLLHSIGLPLQPAIWSWTGSESNFGFVLGLLIGYPIMLGLAIWVGDLFWRAVDIPCTKLARKLENFVA